MEKKPPVFDYTTTLQRLTKNSLVDKMVEDMIDPPDERPFKWRVDKIETLETETYRKIILQLQRITWKPPEKEMADNQWWPMFCTKKPDGLDEHLQSTKWHYKSTPLYTKRYSGTLAEMKADIDAHYKAIKEAKRLAKLINYLDGLPCKCGEYGTWSEADKLEYASHINHILGAKSS